MLLLFKKILILTLVITLLSFNLNVIAASPASGSTNIGDYEKDLGKKYLEYGAGSNLIVVLENMINYFMVVAYVLVFLFLGISGVKFMTSLGDKAKKTNAMDSLKNALIALIVILGINLFINLFINIFSGGKTGITASVELTRTF